MMNINHIVLVFTIICIGVSAGQAVRRSSYGEYCNETMKCDKGAWLTCQNTSCTCMLEDMVYDPPKLKCVSRSGDRCKFQISDHTSENVGLALYENTDCVSNANCNNEFTCACEPGFYETLEGKCLGQKDSGRRCLSSVECQEAKLLFCIEGICQCSNDSHHIYARPQHGNLSTCVGMAGKPLSGRTSCADWSELQNGFCVCIAPDSFYPGEDGRCYQRKTRKESCARDEECKFKGEFSTCVGGLCDCDPQKYTHRTFVKSRTVEEKVEIEVDGPWNRSPNSYFNNLFYRRGTYTHVYGTWVRGNRHGTGYISSMVNKTVVESLSQCVGLARLPCNPELNCVKDSTCLAGGNGAQLCTCQLGFSPTSMGTCGIGHGGHCSNSTTCSDSFLCTDGKCNCPQINHQLYLLERKKCAGLVSFFCADESDCLPNSGCTVHPKTGRAQCACSSGFVENGIGRCEKAWSMRCEYKDPVPCDTVANLQCRNNICACPDTMTHFDETRRRCLGLVGSRCQIEGSSKCVTGAECVQPDPKVAGRCYCQEGFMVDPEKLVCANVVKVEKAELTTESENEVAPVMTQQMAEIKQEMAKLTQEIAEMAEIMQEMAEITQEMPEMTEIEQEGTTETQTKSRDEFF